VFFLSQVHRLSEFRLVRAYIVFRSLLEACFGGSSEGIQAPIKFLSPFLAQRTASDKRGFGSYVMT